MNAIEAANHSKSTAATRLKAAVAILDKWGASGEQGAAILRVSRSTYARAKRHDPAWKVSLDADQLTRISLVLNIHELSSNLVDGEQVADQPDRNAA